MKAEREWLDPAKRSILAKTSLDSVIDVFSFILPIYHEQNSCEQGATRTNLCGRKCLRDVHLQP